MSTIDKLDPLRMIFFDTETTGFRPGNICQLSYLLVDGDEVEPKNFFFKVNNVDPGAERVHGLSVRKLAKLSNNKTFQDSFHVLNSDFSNADILIAHNFNFDLNFIRTEFSRCKHDFKYIDSICTMRHFTDICKIPKSNGYGYKWPKLGELTQYLGIKDKEILNATKEIFEISDTGYHDARFDTIATYLSYMKAVEMGLIKNKKLAY